MNIEELIREINSENVSASGWSNADWFEFRSSYRVFSGLTEEIVHCCRQLDVFEEGQPLTGVLLGPHSGLSLSDNKEQIASFLKPAIIRVCEQWGRGSPQWERASPATLAP